MSSTQSLARRCSTAATQTSKRRASRDGICGGGLLLQQLALLTLLALLGCWRRALVLLLALPLLQLLALPVARAGRGLPLRSGLRLRGRRRCGRWLRSERSRRGRRRRGRRRNGLRGMRGRQRREGSGGGGDSSEGERGGRQNGAAERTTRRAEALGGEGAGAAEYDQPVSFE